MHNTLQRYERGKEHRRQALLDAANSVFAERGYDCATTREIAERAGCAEGLIHRYFNGKRGLLLAILQHRASHVAGEFGARLSGCDCVHEEIERIFLYYLDLNWERREFMRVCVSQSAIDPPIGRSIHDGLLRSQVEFIVARLAVHQDAGRIGADTGIEALAYTIAGIGFAIGFMYQVGFQGSRPDAERIVRQAASALAGGVAPRPIFITEEVRP